MHNLLVHFAKERDAVIDFGAPEGFRELGEWVKTADVQHRWHIRVRPRKQPGS